MKRVLFILGLIVASLYFIMDFLGVFSSGELLRPQYHDEDSVVCCATGEINTGDNNCELWCEKGSKTIAHGIQRYHKKVVNDTKLTRWQYPLENPENGLLLIMEYDYKNGKIIYHHQLDGNREVKYNVEWEVICCEDLPVSKCKIWCEGDGRTPADGLQVFAAYNGLYKCMYKKGKLGFCGGWRGTGTLYKSRDWLYYKVIADEKMKERTPAMDKYCRLNPTHYSVLCKDVSTENGAEKLR